MAAGAGEIMNSQIIKIIYRKEVKLYFRKHTENYESVFILGS